MPGPPLARTPRASPWTRALLPPRHSVVNQWDLLTPLGIGPPDPARDPVEMADRCRRAPRSAASRLAAAGVADDAAADRAARQRRQPVPALAARLVRRRSPPRWRVAIDRAASSSPRDRRRPTPPSAVADAAARSWPATPAAAHRPTAASSTLAELRALVARAALYIGGDSGPMHIAATTRGADRRAVRPDAARALDAVARSGRSPPRPSMPAPLPCRPCHQRVCVPGDFRCLTTITPDDGDLAAAEQPAGWRPNP